MDIRKGFMTSAALLVAVAGGHAAASPQYAYVYSDVDNGSDVLVSVPINLNLIDTVTLTSVSGTGNTILNFADSAEFAAGDFDAGTFVSHYVRITSGAAAGLWSSITVNTETSVTIDDSDVAALLAGNETVEIYPHHTLSSVFPDTLLDDADSTLPSALGKGMLSDGLQVLLYSDADSQNKAAGSGGVIGYTTFFGAGWGSDADRPLLPEQPFVIRNNTGNDLIYAAPGYAPGHPIAYLTAAAERDTAFGTGFPVPITLDETGLGTFDGRQILTQTDDANAAAGSANIFGYTTFFGAGWGSDADTELPANKGFILRQPSGDTGGVSIITSPY